MDPHDPTPFNAFPPFNNSNPFTVQNHPFYGGVNNHLYQPQPQTPPIPPHSSFTHPPYSDMICTAIAALNESDGSSKQAISSYIERIYIGLPPSHAALLTHHLKTLKNSGILMMVKKSYKFAADTTRPTSVAVAAAAAAAGLKPSRSDLPDPLTSSTPKRGRGRPPKANIVNENQFSPDLVAFSTPQSQKRGRGRPPKANIVNENQFSSDPVAFSTPQSQKRGRGRPPKVNVVNENQFSSDPVASSTPQTHKRGRGRPPKASIVGNSSWEQSELPVSSQSLVKRGRGRPRKDGSSPLSGGLETAKRRGRPPSVRAAGRERKPIVVVSAPVSVFPYVANSGGVRRGRGRPKRVDSVATPLVVAKRGRGRPRKIGGVMRKPMKLHRGGYIRTGKPRGRPRKNAVSLGASGQQDAEYEELKKKIDLFQEKAKEIVNVLKGEIGEGSENQAVVEAIHALEELTVTTTKETTTTMEEAEPQHMEEVVEPEETEPELEGEGQGQEQTETEAFPDSLF